ncbi:MAG: hypothetical protein QN120_11510 [Armatimonadota bacterium]|nr:hypothetical protein [Armatimonadota bacterium]
MVELRPWQVFAVPRGVGHRTHVPERSVVLMAGGEGVVPTGDLPRDASDNALLSGAD